MTVSVKEAANYLSSQSDILILTHVRPDGDTIGCAAALCHGLRFLGKTAYVLPNPQTTPLYACYVEKLLAPAEYHPSCVVSVDMAAPSLFPENALPYLERVDLAIDHHPSQTFFAARTCLDASRAACGELLYDLLCEMGAITPEAAAPLYVAISTDCGCFAYNNTTPNTHRIVASLMELGIPTAALNKRHFKTKSFTRLKLEKLLIDSIELHENGIIGIISISQDMMDSIGATEQDADDMSAFIGQVEGVLIGATIRELQPGICKLSLRTDPTVLNASKTCALLGGGGHAAAAGATMEGSMEHAKDLLLSAIHQTRHETAQ